MKWTEFCEITVAYLKARGIELDVDELETIFRFHAHAIAMNLASGQTFQDPFLGRFYTLNSDRAPAAPFHQWRLLCLEVAPHLEYMCNIHQKLQENSHD